MCSKYDKLLYQLYNDPPEHIQEYLKSIAELLAYCKEHAGGVSKAACANKFAK